MLAIDFPEPRFHDVALEAEARSRELAANTEVLKEPPLLKRLSVAEPIVVPLSPKKVYQDPDIANFITKQKDRQQFFLVRLACSFAPPDGEPINRAWVVVELHGAKRTEPTASVVIAMDPNSLSDTQKVERSLKASATVKLAAGSLTFEGGGAKSKPEAELFMVALGVGKNAAAWEMYQTTAMKIGGIYVYNLIVQVPAKQITHGTVNTNVEIKRKLFGIVTYKAMLDEHPSSKFICSSAD